MSSDGVKTCSTVPPVLPRNAAARVPITPACVAPFQRALKGGLPLPAPQDGSSRRRPSLARSSGGVLFLSSLSYILTPPAPKVNRFVKNKTKTAASRWETADRCEATGSISRVLSRATIYLDDALPRRSSHLSKARRAGVSLSVGVAPDRVYMAVRSPARR